MRMSVATMVLAALALAACGGGEADETAANGEAMSLEEAAAAVEDAVRLRSGQYETRVEILDFAMPGMPEAQVAQMRQMMSGRSSPSSTFCLTPEEAEQGPERMVQEMAEADCVFNAFDMTRGHLSADMQCTSAEGMQGNYVLDGEMTADSSTMTMQIDQSVPGVPGGGQVQMEMRVTSQRKGDCT